MWALVRSPCWTSFTRGLRGLICASPCWVVTTFKQIMAKCIMWLLLRALCLSGSPCGEKPMQLQPHLLQPYRHSSEKRSTLNINGYCSRREKQSIDLANIGLNRCQIRFQAHCFTINKTNMKLHAYDIERVNMIFSPQSETVLV